MRINLPLNSGINLEISSEPTWDKSYPSARIQKGLILYDQGEELCEEAVGFGVPILKRGLQTIFPGELELFPPDSNFSSGLHARYKMNLEEKIAVHDTGTISNPIIYRSKYVLAALIRRLPFLRRLLTQSSNLLRSSLSWETIYEPGDFATDISMIYSIVPDGGGIRIELDGKGLSQSGITEVIVMNEQGAHHFNQYQDSDGLSQLAGEIGCWDRVSAKGASFISTHHQIAFSLSQVSSARLYRGRELVGTRLAWAGFGYTFPPSLDHFACEITVRRLI